MWRLAGQQCHSARAARARTSDTRDTSQALHHKPPFLKRPPPPRPSSLERHCVGPSGGGNSASAWILRSAPATKKPRHKDTTGDVCPRTAPHPVQYTRTRTSATARCVSFIHSFSSVTQPARHAHAQVTRETHHKRCTTSHLFSNVVKHVFPLLACLRLRTRTSTLRMNAGVPRALPSVSSPPSFRPSSSVRDVLWERALSGLPDQLLSALRAAELDEPGILFEYPKMTVEELKGTMGEKLGDHVAPSGAASSGQPLLH